LEGAGIGEPTELALLHLGRDLGVEKAALSRRQVRVDEIPFSSNTKRMCTLHREEGRYVEYMKGAPVKVLAACSWFWNGKEAVPLNGTLRCQITEAVEAMSDQALRVLAAAYKDTAHLQEEGLIFLGIVGMLDPVRPEAAGAIDDFGKAGVRTVMITGDDPRTGAAIGRQLGLLGDQKTCITGDMLDRMGDEELEAQVGSAAIFARVSPEHKCRIVRAFQQHGQIVAMTGDGTNDAPALRLADIGIAMGKGGTDVARNAADFVLTDDNFATIRDAISEGRSIYENIKKTVVFLLSSNFGEIITMLGAVAAGLSAPLKPSHILWINLITDTLPALALGCDDNDREALLHRPPRKPGESLFAHGGLALTCFYGLLIAAISLAAFLYLPVILLLRGGYVITLKNLGMVLGQSEVLLHAQTYAFTVLGLSQLFHAIGMRDVRQSVFRMNPLDNPLMLLSLGAGIGLQLLVTEVPFLVTAFQTAMLTLSEWGILLGLSMVPLLAHEGIAIGKWVKIKLSSDHENSR
jgi:Ca2+-transporting ATPase